MDLLWTQFHLKVFELDNAVQLLSQTAPDTLSGSAGKGPLPDVLEPLISRDASPETHQARKSVLEISTLLHCMLRDPVDLLDHLAFQTQLLACLQWLGSFQILACIPLNHPTAFEDVAGLAAVPKGQLIRVTRIAAMAGFLHEPEPGYVAHTALSAQFVLKPSFLDALMFISESATPTALQMTRATKMYGETQKPDQSAYRLAFQTSAGFAATCEQQKKLRRQYVAFNRLGVNENYTDLPTLYDWASLGRATVVEVCAQSTATASALAKSFPYLHLIVQIIGDTSFPPHPHVQASEFVMTGTSDNAASELSENETGLAIQYRALGTQQTVHGAAIYILRIAPLSTARRVDQVVAELNVELRSHFSVLRASPDSLLILILHLLPEPGALDHNVEANLRAQDLLLHQLAKQQLLEQQDVLEAVKNVEDSTGRLVLVKNTVDRQNSIFAFEVKFETHSIHTL